jgi:hypothetical protein
MLDCFTLLIVNDLLFTFALFFVFLLGLG